MSNNKLNEFSEDFALDELESADSIDELPHNRKDEKELEEIRFIQKSCTIILNI